MALLTGLLPLGQLADLSNVSWILAFTLVSYSTIVIRKQFLMLSVVLLCQECHTYL